MQFNWKASTDAMVSDKQEHLGVQCNVIISVEKS